MAGRVSACTAASRSRTAWSSSSRGRSAKSEMSSSAPARVGLQHRAQLGQAPAAGRADAADGHLQRLGHRRVVGPGDVRDDAQQRAAAFRQPLEVLPQQPGPAPRRAAARPGPGRDRAPPPAGSRRTAAARRDSSRARHASRRVAVTSQEVSACGDRISCSRRSSSSQLVCTTSADSSAVRPCARATCHSSGFSSRTTSPSARVSPFLARSRHAPRRAARSVPARSGGRPGAVGPGPVGSSLARCPVRPVPALPLPSVTTVMLRPAAGSGSAWPPGSCAASNPAAVAAANEVPLHHA